MEDVQAMCCVLETRLARLRRDSVCVYESVTRWGAWIVETFDSQAGLWGFFFLREWELPKEVGSCMTVVSWAENSFSRLSVCLWSAKPSCKTLWPHSLPFWNARKRWGVLSFSILESQGTSPISLDIFQAMSNPGSHEVKRFLRSLFLCAAVFSCL